VTWWMLQPGHMAIPGMPMMISISQEIAESNRLSLTGKVLPLVTIIGSTLATVPATGTRSLLAFVITETTADLANRTRCRRMITVTMSGTEMPHHVYLTLPPDIFEMSRTSKTRSLRAFAITESLAAIASLSQRHITKTGPVRTGYLFLEREKFRTSLQSVKFKISLPLTAITETILRRCRISPKLSIRIGHTTISHLSCVRISNQIKLIALSLLPPHLWSSPIARLMTVLCHRLPLATMSLVRLRHPPVLSDISRKARNLGSIQMAGYTLVVLIGMHPESIFASYVKSMWMHFSVSCFHLT